MAKRITIYPDIYQKVQIAFTLTPKATNAEGEYRPVAFDTKLFYAEDQSPQTLEWYSEVGFRAWRPAGKTAITLEGKHCAVPPNYYVELHHQSEPDRRAAATNSPWFVWSKSKPANLEASSESVTVLNGTGSTRMITFGCVGRSPDPIFGGHACFYPLACCKLRDKAIFSNSTSLVLQAFRVDIQTSGSEYRVLHSRDLLHPVLAEPLQCDSLSPSSNWGLSESNGVFSLRNVDREVADLEDLALRLKAVEERSGAIASEVDRLKVAAASVAAENHTLRSSRERSTLPE